MPGLCWLVVCRIEEVPGDTFPTVSFLKAGAWQVVIGNAGPRNNRPSKEVSITGQRLGVQGL